MTTPIDSDGPAAPPRANGELVFAEPWESRAFGMAVMLSEAGVFTWPQFQAALIDRITQWQTTSPEDASWNYYQHWLGALEDLLTATGTMPADHITTRAHTLAQRPDGHDHGH